MKLYIAIYSIIKNISNINNINDINNYYKLKNCNTLKKINEYLLNTYNIWILLNDNKIKLLNKNKITGKNIILSKKNKEYFLIYNKNNKLIRFITNKTIDKYIINQVGSAFKPPRNPTNIFPRYIRHKLSRIPEEKIFEPSQKKSGVKISRKSNLAINPSRNSQQSRNIFPLSRISESSPQLQVIKHSRNSQQTKGVKISRKSRVPIKPSQNLQQSLDIIPLSTIQESLPNQNGIKLSRRSRKINLSSRLSSSTINFQIIFDILLQPNTTSHLFKRTPPNYNEKISSASFGSFKFNLILNDLKNPRSYVRDDIFDYLHYRLFLKPLKSLQLIKKSKKTKKYKSFGGTDTPTPLCDAFLSILHIFDRKHDFGKPRNNETMSVPNMALMNKNALESIRHIIDNKSALTDKDYLKKFFIEKYETNKTFETDILIYVLNKLLYGDFFGKNIISLFSFYVIKKSQFVDTGSNPLHTNKNNNTIYQNFSDFIINFFDLSSMSDDKRNYVIDTSIVVRKGDNDSAVGDAFTWSKFTKEILDKHFTKYVPLEVSFDPNTSGKIQLPASINIEDFNQISKDVYNTPPSDPDKQYENAFRSITQNYFSLSYHTIGTNQYWIYLIFNIDYYYKDFDFIKFKKDTSRIIEDPINSNPAGNKKISGIVWNTGGFSVGLIFNYIDHLSTNYNLDKYIAFLKIIKDKPKKLNEDILQFIIIYLFKSGASKENIVEILFDFKKSGDWGQVLFCKHYNKMFTDTTTLFVTGDRLCGLYSLLQLSIKTLFSIDQRFLNNNITADDKSFIMGLYKSKVSLTINDILTIITNSFKFNREYYNPVTSMSARTSIRGIQIHRMFTDNYNKKIREDLLKDTDSKNILISLFIIIFREFKDNIIPMFKSSVNTKLLNIILENPVEKDLIFDLIDDAFKNITDQLIKITDRINPTQEIGLQSDDDIMQHINDLIIYIYDIDNLINILEVCFYKYNYTEHSYLYASMNELKQNVENIVIIKDMSEFIKKYNEDEKEKKLIIEQKYNEDLIDYIKNLKDAKDKVKSLSKKLSLSPDEEKIKKELLDIIIKTEKKINTFPLYIISAENDTVSELKKLMGDKLKKSKRSSVRDLTMEEGTDGPVAKVNKRSRGKKDIDMEEEGTAGPVLLGKRTRGQSSHDLDEESSSSRTSKIPRKLNPNLKYLEDKMDVIALDISAANFFKILKNEGRNSKALYDLYVSYTVPHTVGSTSISERNPKQDALIILMMNEMLNNLIKNIDDIKILDTFLKKIKSLDDTDIKYEGLYNLIKKYHIDATPDFKNYGKYISNIEEAIIQSIDESSMKDNDEEEDDTTSLLNSVSFYYKSIFSLIYLD